MRQLTEEEFLSLIRDDVDKAGSQKVLAKRLKISEQYLSDVLKRRRAPGDKILAAYNYRSVRNYVKEKK